MSLSVLNYMLLNILFVNGVDTYTHIYLLIILNL